MSSFVTPVTDTPNNLPTEAEVESLPSEETSVNQFWIACFTMWVSLLKHPLLPEKESHRFVLLEFQALYSKFFYDYGQERDLDRGKEDHVRLAIIEDLGNIGRALVILSEKIGATEVRGAAETRHYMGRDDVVKYAGWVDKMIECECGEDEEKIWNVCGFCLMSIIDDLKLKVLVDLHRCRNERVY